MKTTSTQTETPDESLESSYGSKEDLVDDIIERTFASPGLNLCVMPHGLDSSESTSYSTEDTSSMTFDDDDVIISGVNASQIEFGFRVSKSDIIFQMDEIRTKLQQIKEEVRNEIIEVCFANVGGDLNYLCCDCYADYYDYSNLLCCDFR